MLQKSINDKKFNDVFVEVPYLETLGQHANEQLRLFRMKEVISNRFSKTSLQEFLEWNVGQYVFSRSQIEQFELEGNVFSVGMEALDLMRKSGHADERGTGNEVGEILLYAFLESVLGAPKIYSKVELNVSVRSDESVSDGMHLLSLGGDEHTLSYEMVFGASSVIGDLRIAIDKAFERVQQIEKHASTEIHIVDSTVFELPEKDPVAQQLNEIITPRPDKTVCRDTAYGLFLGYTLGLDPNKYSSQEYRDLVDKKITAGVSNALPQIKEKIAELGLTNRSFYVYILPFDDAEDDKKSIMKNVMREGENDA